MLSARLMARRYRCLPGSDHFSTATTVSGMMGILMSNRWTKRANDTSWQHALATCMRCSQLETDTTKARAAFVDAARAAGYKVLPDDEQAARKRFTVNKRSDHVQWRQPGVG